MSMTRKEMLERIDDLFDKALQEFMNRYEFIAFEWLSDKEADEYSDLLDKVYRNES